MVGIDYLNFMPNLSGRNSHSIATAECELFVCAQQIGLAAQKSKSLEEASHLTKQTKQARPFAWSKFGLYKARDRLF